MQGLNRTKLLRAALTLFAARGYDAVGVQEIVEAAEVTKPTLYHYFGSKRGVLDVLLQEYFGLLHEGVGKAAGYRGDLPKNLTDLVFVHFQFAKEHPAFYRMQLALWFAPPESEAYQAVHSLNERQSQLVVDLFSQALPHMRGRHHQYAATLIGMINTYIGLWLNGYVELDDELVYKAVHQFMHGIYS